jgi:capsid protein
MRRAESGKRKADANGRSRVNGSGRKTAYGYDAVADKKRRRPPITILRSEDSELSSADRRTAVATARDVPRNYEVAAWMVRKHLDYVSSFEFSSQNEIEPLDTQIEELVERLSEPERFDAAGRHGRRRFLRIAEARRVLDGDVGVMKLAAGQVQGIEGDRIRATAFSSAALPRVDPERLIHGVQVDQAGRAIAYALSNRGPMGDDFRFDRMVPAENFYLHGYFDRFDQVRGVAPFLTACNRLQDTYENFDYALAKSKVEQIFALALYRNAETVDASGEVTETLDATGKPIKTKTEQKFPGAAAVFDFDIGEKAEFLNSQHPSSQFKEFSQFMIAVAMLALDMPYCFFDASIANFTVSRHARLLYEQSCEPKQRDNRHLLGHWTRWRLALAILDGDLVLPAGMDVAGLKFEWIHKGQPWVQPREEVIANSVAVKEGFTSTPRVTKLQGNDAYQIVDEQASYMAYRQEKLGPYLGGNPGADFQASDPPGGTN